jgi:hypothetical protein
MLQYVPPVEVDLTSIGPLKADQEARYGAFATSRFSHKGNGLTPVYAKGYALGGHHSASSSKQAAGGECLTEVTYLKKGEI